MRINPANIGCNPIRASATIGLDIAHRDYGKTVCPHCEAEVERTTRNQITCGKSGCQRKQLTQKNRERKARLAKSNQAARR